MATLCNLLNEAVVVYIADCFGREDISFVARCRQAIEAAGHEAR